MNIIETKIPDVTPETLNKSKLVLANNIIQSVYPLFDEVYQGKVGALAPSRKILKEKKTKVRERGTK
jgi:hypothetical protein